MSLPIGFDPQRMTFGEVRTASMPRNRYTSSTSSYSQSYPSAGYSTNYARNYTLHRPSLWSRLNDGVGAFGNWIDDHIENIVTWCTIIALVLLYGGAIIWVFKASNLFYGILRVFGAIFIVGIGSVITYIGSFIGGIVLKVIRFIFWNLWTLLIAIVLIAGLNIYSHAKHGHRVRAAQTEVVEDHNSGYSTPYRCTAYELNVRSKPNKTSAALGTISHGDVVEVFEVENNFGRIYYNGQEGYVSMRYLEEWY